MAVTTWSIRGEGRAQAPGDVISKVGIDRDRRNQLDDARARAKAGQRINDQRKAMGEVIAGTAIEPHSRALLTGNDAKAIVLDLVQPLCHGNGRTSGAV